MNRQGLLRPWIVLPYPLNAQSVGHTEVEQF
jgi:hypothetical protein